MKLEFPPFDIYTFEINLSEFGHIWYIPNFLDDEELESTMRVVEEQLPCESHVYPQKYKQIPISKKMKWIWENQLFLRPSWRNNGFYIRYTYGVQVSPAHMKEYPIHDDNGKMTFMCPLWPEKANTTKFHARTNNDITFEPPWEVNTCYFFQGSLQTSKHSYKGGDTDRALIRCSFLTSGSSGLPDWSTFPPPVES